MQMLHFVTFLGIMNSFTQQSMNMWQGYEVAGELGIQCDAHAFLTDLLGDLVRCGLFAPLRLKWDTTCLSCGQVSL